MNILKELKKCFKGVLSLYLIEEMDKILFMKYNYLNNFWRSYTLLQNNDKIQMPKQLFLVEMMETSLMGVLKPPKGYIETLIEFYKFVGVENIFVFDFKEENKKLKEQNFNRILVLPFKENEIELFLSIEKDLKVDYCLKRISEGVYEKSL